MDFDLVSEKWILKLDQSLKGHEIGSNKYGTGKISLAKRTPYMLISKILHHSVISVAYSFSLIKRPISLRKELFILW